MLDVRRSIAAQVHKFVGADKTAEGWVRGPRDDGLVPFEGAAWTVHSDFATMMIGGVSALLLQMLHPAALAGVWDHSNFRRDMQGRLQRTAQFMAVTTYGSTPHADSLVARVNRIHDAVTGTLQDGMPYRANDPATLTFVQVGGAWSFLQAYLRYRDPFMTGAAQDAYYAETAVIAARLGATDIPTTRRGIDAYWRMIRPQLLSDARTREVVGVILNSPPPHAAVGPLSKVMFDAGIDLLPKWAQQLHGLDVPLHRRPFVRAGAGGIGAVLRWALTHERERRRRETLATAAVRT